MYDCCQLENNRSATFLNMVEKNFGLKRVKTFNTEKYVKFVNISKFGLIKIK